MARCRVNLDYHVEIERHYYSVPFQLLRQTVEARITARRWRCSTAASVVASHLRSLRRHRHSTVPDHMPSSHRRYRDWTHERIRREAAAIGDDAAALMDRDPALATASRSRGSAPASASCGWRRG